LNTWYQGRLPMKGVIWNNVDGGFVRYWPKADIGCCTCKCPLLGVKRTCPGALQMSAYGRGILLRLPLLAGRPYIKRQVGWRWSMKLAFIALGLLATSGVVYAACFLCP